MRPMSRKYSACLLMKAKYVAQPITVKTARMFCTVLTVVYIFLGISSSK